MASFFFFVPPYYSYQSGQSHKTHTGALGARPIAPPRLLASGVWAADGGGGPTSAGTEWPQGGANTDEGSETQGVGVELFTGLGNFPPGDASLSVLTGDKFVCAEAVDGSVSP